jgi:hypothetical protein
MKPHQACQRCNVRWRQKGVLCRSCERETGVDNRSLFERQKEKVERDHERSSRLTRVEYTSPPLRTVMIRGREYDVVWDGSIAALREQGVSPQP